MPAPRGIPKRLAGFAVALAIAVGLTIGAAASDRWPGDLRLAEAIQAWPAWAGPIADALRAATGTQVVLASGAAACVVLWFAGLRAHAIALAVALIVLPFLQSGLKDVVDRARPDPTLLEYRGSATSPSFPSGHVMSGTVLYGWLALVAYQRGGRWRMTTAGLVALLAASALANVYEGVHWPSDVAGGLAWAAVLLVAADALRSRIERGRGLPG